jgi:hypothetical protein
LVILPTDPVRNDKVSAGRHDEDSEVLVMSVGGKSVEKLGMRLKRDLQEVVYTTLTTFVGVGRKALKRTA